MKLLIAGLFFGLLGSAAMAQEPIVESKTYRITLTNNWNIEDHLAVPGNAHFSPVVAIAHSSDYDLLPIGSQASSGLEGVAELGSTSNLAPEVNAARTAGTIGDVVATQNMFISQQSSQSFEVTITPEHPYLSMVSMIAPSPDWVVGISNLKLYSASTGFYQGIQRPLPLLAIDAGTEGGDFAGNYSLNNEETLPKNPINVLSGPGFDVPYAFVTIEEVLTEDSEEQ